MQLILFHFLYLFSLLLLPSHSWMDIKIRNNKKVVSIQMNEKGRRERRVEKKENAYALIVDPDQRNNSRKWLRSSSRCFVSYWSGSQDHSLLFLITFGGPPSLWIHNSFISFMCESMWWERPTNKVKEI